MEDATDSSNHVCTTCKSNAGSTIYEYKHNQCVLDTPTNCIETESNPAECKVCAHGYALSGTDCELIDIYGCKTGTKDTTDTCSECFPGFAEETITGGVDCRFSVPQCETYTADEQVCDACFATFTKATLNTVAIC